MENTEITSVNNELVKATAKLLQKKFRDEEKKFILEGFKVIEEAYSAKLELERVFVLKESLSKYDFLPKEKIILTNEPVLKKISSTDSAPEAVAVGKQKIFTTADLRGANKVVLLENIKDSGNLGTILRTAVAFGQDAVILYGDTVDLYNPKCVRSAVGNLWKKPVVQIKDFAHLQEIFTKFERVATLPSAKDTILLKEFVQGRTNSQTLVMFGSEADGLSQDLIDFSTKKVTIEMDSSVESLNLSVSVGVVLYELMG